MPTVLADKLKWLQNFANKLGTYSAKYGITAAEVADMVASSAYYTIGVTMLINTVRLKKK